MGCTCGNKTDALISYFSKENGLRVTVCSKCGTAKGFDDKDKWDNTPYSKITAAQNNTPEPNAE